MTHRLWLDLDALMTLTRENGYIWNRCGCSLFRPKWNIQL